MHLQRLATFLALGVSLVVSSPTGPVQTPTKRSVPAGFVTTNGREFELDGKPFVRLTTMPRKIQLIFDI